MASYPYTGRLTDFAERPFPSAVPRLWVSPERAAIGPNGPLADRRVPVEVDSLGNFTVRLTPSAQTTPPTPYYLQCDWLDGSDSGQDNPRGYSEWSFVAAIGGGPIADMALIPITEWWVGPLPPPNPAAGIWWLDTSAYPYLIKKWV